MTDLITRELELSASPADVWTALTDSDWLGEWLADEAELEPRPGGEARFTIGDEVRTGWVEEATAPVEGAPGRLAFWWQQPGEPASRVTLELSRTANGTRLLVRETRPLEILDLVGIPLGGWTPAGGRPFGPALVAA